MCCCSKLSAFVTDARWRAAVFHSIVTCSLLQQVDYLYHTVYSVCFCVRFYIYLYKWLETRSSDVMLVWRKGNIEKNSLCYSNVFCYNGAQRYEQFLQVGRLYLALILLGLALSSQCLCVFGLHGGAKKTSRTLYNYNGAYTLWWEISFCAFVDHMYCYLLINFSDAINDVSEHCLMT